MGSALPQVLRGGVGTPPQGDALDLPARRGEGRIVPARTAAQVGEAQRLFQAYAASLDFQLCFQDFDRELASLPGDYADPAGRLLLLERDGRAVGCVALRPLGGGACEMKRLYLEPGERGGGLGRRLAEAVIEAARAIGYRRLRLDTVPSMGSAISLYRSLGFHEIPAYRENPVPGALFFELEL